ncbi:MAG: hypothetical protein JJU09_00500 [Rhodobacteraceae bacterium]|nr:hypothetical protein [Paracoccaceae bacterium]
MKHQTFPDMRETWQRGKAWRKLPYARGVWAGPMGRTEYLADRDYTVIAYRDAAGSWRRGNGESLKSSPMVEATYIWEPGSGRSPAVNAAVLRDLLSRCAQHPSTAWLIEGARV